MITLERTKTVMIPFMGVDVDVLFKVPTAEEAEKAFRGSDVKDTDIFRKFVISVRSSGIEGWDTEIKADAVVSLPGTYSLVNKVALEITKATFLTEAEKN